MSGKTPQSLIADNEDAIFDMLRQTGSDLNILTYAFNYKVNGVLNTNLEEVNAFNKAIYDRISIKPDGRDIYNKVDIINHLKSSISRWAMPTLHQIKLRLCIAEILQLYENFLAKITDSLFADNSSFFQFFSTSKRISSR